MRRLASIAAALIVRRVATAGTARIPLFESAPSPGEPADVAVAAQPSSGCDIVYGLEGGP